MTGPDSPSVWRRWLALELRRLRDERGMTQSAAARACGWSGPRLSYLENTQQHVATDDLDKLLPLYGVPEDSRERYYNAVAQSHRRGWWERFDPLVPDWVSMYVGLEQGAVEIRSYEPLLVPGLLQTEGYTTSIMGSGLRPRSHREIDRLVELRQARQHILTRDDPVELSVVLDESTLRRSPPGDGMMAEQVRHLVETAARPNVTIRVLPLDRGIQSYTPGPFSILSFEWQQTDPGVVFIEYRGGSLYLEEFEDVERHALAFDGLIDLALSPDDSLATMRETERQLLQ